MIRLPARGLSRPRRYKFRSDEWRWDVVSSITFKSEVSMISSNLGIGVVVVSE